MHHALRALLLMAAGVCIACGDSGGGDRGAVDANGCGRLSQCAISDRACQQSVLAVTACLRGDAVPPLPPVRTITREQLRAELLALAAATLDGMDAAQLVKTRSLDEALELLHLQSMDALSDASVDVATQGYAAFYRADTKDITLISDTTEDPVAAMNELSHEFAHYLQDQSGQLEPLIDPQKSFDAIVASRALLESEAVVISFRFSAQMSGVAVADIRWSTLFDTLEIEVDRGINRSSSPFLAAMSGLQYVIASRPIERAWEQMGRAGVDALFDQPPRTQLEWLGQAAEKLACNPPPAPDGFELVGVDSLGVAGVTALYATRALASVGVGGYWRQDRLAVYRARAAAQSGERALLAVWRLRLPDEPTVTRVRSVVDPLGLAQTSMQTELTISVSSDAQQAPLSGAALAACATDEQLAGVLPAPPSMQASWRFPHAAGRWFDRRLFAASPR